jgi:hypothetical protein
MQPAFLKVLTVLILSLVLLLGYEYVHEHYGFLGGFRSPHFFTAPDTTVQAAAVSFEVDSLDAILVEIQSDSSARGEDSSAQGGIQLPGYTGPSSFFVPPLSPALPKDTTVDAQYEGKEYLDPFMKAFEQLRVGQRKKLRIAYYGDSTTEGDLTVAELRDLLQRQYGGQGVGFVPIVTLANKGRITIRHDYSPQWIWKKYFKKQDQIGYDFGLMGDYAIPGRLDSQSLWVSFKPTVSKSYPNCSSFGKVYLFYGRKTVPDSAKPIAKGRVSVTSNGSENRTYELSAENPVNKVLVNELASSSLYFKFFFEQIFPIFGFSFEGDEGVYVDNLAKRSDSGSHFHKINGAVLQGFQAHFQYDLIILHFGPNVLMSSVLNYSHYEDILVHNIQHFQRNMPGVPILIIGHPDRAAKVGDQLKTDPALPGLILAQRRAAFRTNCAFFDLFSAMGGAGTMVKWVQEGVAAPDYVHFSFTGAKRIALLLAGYLGIQEG